MRRELTLNDVLEYEAELGWPLRKREDAAEEALRLELVAGNRWGEFPILRCGSCREFKPAPAFPHDQRCTKRRQRGYSCVACVEAGR